MPIRDYKHNAEVAKARFYLREDVSETNKGYVTKFLDSYDVSPARMAIFFKHIYHLLKKTKDIKKDMDDRDKINRYFKELRESMGKSYYATVKSVGKMFVRWLNEGDLPKGFKDLNGTKKKDMQRKLNPDDMITWEDGVKISKATNSVQWKALILTQLDGGFRPSELIDLRYGDIKQKGDFIIARVRDGKTGARSVILFKCVPYLLKWKNEHPTRKDQDPLWIMEYGYKSHKKAKDPFRYTYDAVRKRLREIGEKAGIKKPLDLYSLRHSACTIAKKDNIPIEEAAKKFGHSVKYFSEVYGRLSTDDSIERLSKHFGLKEDKQRRELNVLCRCGFSNPPNTEICEQCGNPLSLKIALEREQGQEQKIRELEDKMTFLAKQFGSLQSLVKAAEIAKSS